jgi:hypothetical protein
VRCPNCHNKVIQKTGDVTRIRAGGPVEFTPDGLCKTKCHWCKAEVTLPLQLKEDVPIPAERFMLPSHKA